MSCKIKTYISESTFYTITEFPTTSLYTFIFIHPSGGTCHIRNKNLSLWGVCSMLYKIIYSINCFSILQDLVSPDGSLCASGGKDGTAMLWDLNDGHLLSSLEAIDVIHCLCFSPNRYWLCAATAKCIKVGHRCCVVYFFWVGFLPKSP